MPAPDSDPPPAASVFAVRLEPAQASAAASEPDLFTALGSADTNGYEIWQQQREQERRAFEKKWGIPLGRRVRLQLSCQGRPVEGVIRLAGDDAKDAAPKDRFLRIRDICFSPREVESLTRL